MRTSAENSLGLRRRQVRRRLWRTLTPAGRMVMRRGTHTSRVLNALGSAPIGSPNQAPTPNLSAEEIIPNEFPNLHEEEEE